MNNKILVIGFLLLSSTFYVSNLLAQSQQDDDILDFLPAIIAGAVKRSSLNPPTPPPPLVCETLNLPEEIITPTLIPSGCHIIEEDIIVRSDLTIQPGTELRFRSFFGGYGFIVESGGSISAVGTASRQIILTGKFQPKGWDGIWIKSSSRKNELRYTIIENGGDSYQGSNLRVDSDSDQFDAKVALSNVVLRNSQYNGFVFKSAEITEFSKVTSTNNGLSGSVDLSAVQYLKPGSRLTGNQTNHILLLDSHLYGEHAWHKIGVPFYFDGITLVIHEHLTLKPGVIIQFDRHAGMEVGRNGWLTAIGTAQERILLTGKEEKIGYWKNLTIGTAINKLNQLKYVSVLYGGGAPNEQFPPADLSILAGIPAPLPLTSAMTTTNPPEPPTSEPPILPGTPESPPTEVNIEVGSAFCNAANICLSQLGLADGLRIEMNNVVSQYAWGAGLVVARGAQIEEFSKNTVTDNGRSVVINANQIKHLSPDNIYSGNVHDYIDLQCCILNDSAVWQKLDVPYVASDWLAIRDESSLLIENGVKIYFRNDERFDVERGSQLTVSGTRESPVIFTAIDQKPGGWDGLLFHYGGQGDLNHMVVRFGGANLLQPGSITLDCTLEPITRLSITNSVVADSERLGIATDGEHCQLDARNNLFSNNAEGDITDG